MPDITDSRALTFSDRMLRIQADASVTDYETAKALVAFYTANPVLATLIPNDATHLMRDSANPLSGQGDGRQHIHGALIQGIIDAANQKITWYETVVNGQTRITWYRRVAVGGASRF